MINTYNYNISELYSLLHKLSSSTGLKYSLTIDLDQSGYIDLSDDYDSSPLFFFEDVSSCCQLLLEALSKSKSLPN